MNILLCDLQWGDTVIIIGHVILISDKLIEIKSLKLIRLIINEFRNISLNFKKPACFHFNGKGNNEIPLRQYPQRSSCLLNIIAVHAGRPTEVPVCQIITDDVFQARFVARRLQRVR